MWQGVRDSWHVPCRASRASQYAFSFWAVSPRRALRPLQRRRRRAQPPLGDHCTFSSAAQTAAPLLTRGGGEFAAQRAEGIVLPALRFGTPRHGSLRRSAACAPSGSHPRPDRIPVRIASPPGSHPRPDRIPTRITPALDHTALATLSPRRSPLPTDAQKRLALALERSDYEQYAPVRPRLIRHSWSRREAVVLFLSRPSRRPRCLSARRYARSSGAISRHSSAARDEPARHLSHVISHALCRYVSSLPKAVGASCPRRPYCRAASPAGCETPSRAYSLGCRCSKGRCRLRRRRKIEGTAARVGQRPCWCRGCACR